MWAPTAVFSTGTSDSNIHVAKPIHPTRHQRMFVASFYVLHNVLTISRRHSIRHTHDDHQRPQHYPLPHLPPVPLPRWYPLLPTRRRRIRTRSELQRNGANCARFIPRHRRRCANYAVLRSDPWLGSRFLGRSQHSQIQARLGGYGRSRRYGGCP